MPKSQTVKTDGVDQYDAERFSRLIFATTRKSVGPKGLNQIASFRLSSLNTAIQLTGNINAGILT